MVQPNIVLTGFMGTGKSSVGRLLAERTGRAFIDTDKQIIDQTGRSVSELFTFHGEERFRKLEGQLARDLELVENSVIATGGRMMLDPLNALLLSRNGIIFCLSANVEEIYRRTRIQRNRPLLLGRHPKRQIDELLEDRAAGYSQFRQIDTDGKTESQVANEIIMQVDRLVGDGDWPSILTSELSVRHPAGEYAVIVGQNLLPTLTSRISLEKPFVVISDHQVGELYGSSIGPAQPLKFIAFPPGEDQKLLRTVNQLYSQLLEAGLDRQGAIVALGGGVVGDTAGFVAATFMRGIELIHCPTSLLAMVDASIGGKTAVDLPGGKNLVGAFKQPAAVVSDLSTLRTLPQVELRAGMAEIIKHGVIAGPQLLRRIKRDGFTLPEDDRSNFFQTMVLEAICIKKEIVEADPFEKAERAHLNLGHTFAHGIEIESDYRISHGHAVSIGLVIAAHLSAALNFCDNSVPIYIEEILDWVSLPTRLPASLKPDRLIKAMLVDKKRSSGRMRYVLIRDLGDVFVTDEVPQERIVQILDQLVASSDKAS